MKHYYNWGLLLLAVGVASDGSAARCADVEFEVAWTVTLPDVAGIRCVVNRGDLLFCGGHRASTSSPTADFLIGRITAEDAVEWLASVPTQGDVSRIVLSGRTAFLADLTSKSADGINLGEGLVSIDISDPAHPRKLGVLSMPERYWEGGELLSPEWYWEGLFEVTETRAFAVRWRQQQGSGLTLIDISDPSALRLVGDYPITTWIGIIDFVDGMPCAVFTDDGGSYRVGTLTPGNPDAPIEWQDSFSNAWDWFGMAWPYGVAYHNHFLLSPDTLLWWSWSDDEWGPTCYDLWDIGVSGELAKIGSLILSGNVVGVEKGSIYVVDRAELSAYRLAGLSNPQRVGHLNQAGERGERWSALAVHDTTAFVSGTRKVVENVKVADGIKVIDVSNPTSPREINALSQEALDIGDAVRGLCLDGCRLFVLGDDRVRILEVSDPSQPEDLGAIEILADHVVIDSGLLFAVERSRWEGGEDDGYWVAGELRIFDITAPGAASEVGAFSLRSGPSRSIDAVAVAWPRVYMADHEGLAVVDVSDPSSPDLMSELPWGELGYPSDFIPHDLQALENQVFVASHAGLLVIDVADPLGPVGCGTLASTPPFPPSPGWRPPYGFNTITINEGHAYLLDTYGGLVVADISDPTAPRLVGRNSSISSSETLGQVVVTEALVFAARFSSGLTVFNHYHSAPDIPVVSSEPRGFANGMSIQVKTVPGVDVLLQRSTDLQNWADWTQVRMGKEPIQLADPYSGPDGHQFYRAVAR